MWLIWSTPCVCVCVWVCESVRVREWERDLRHFTMHYSASSSLWPALSFTSYSASSEQDLTKSDTPIAPNSASTSRFFALFTVVCFVSKAGFRSAYRLPRFNTVWKQYSPLYAALKPTLLVLKSSMRAWLILKFLWALTHAFVAELKSRASQSVP